MFSGVDKAVQALLRGQESANRLKSVLENPKKDSVSTEPLFDTVLDSFSMALSFFSNFTSYEPLPYHDSSQNETLPIARKSPKKKSYGEDSLENYRDDSPTPLYNDGFSWRKYGQKKIKTSTHQRCYYRCAYAKDQNCNATKRVQKIQDNPSVYRTTYVGTHICEVNVLSQSNEEDDSKMIRFDKHMVLPQNLSVDDHQETIEYEGINTMNQEYDNNEMLLDDEQFWDYQFPSFSPENFMFLDDISVFD